MGCWRGRPRGSVLHHPHGELEKLGALLPPPPDSDEDSWQSRDSRGWRNRRPSTAGLSTAPAPQVQVHHHMSSGRYWTSSSAYHFNKTEGHGPFVFGVFGISWHGKNTGFGVDGPGFVPWKCLLLSLSLGCPPSDQWQPNMTCGSDPAKEGLAVKLSLGVCRPGP